MLANEFARDNILVNALLTGSDVLALADGRTEASMTRVAMASTGEYTLPSILPIVGY